MQTCLWRASYTPGSWVLLGGPRCLLIIQPAGGPSQLIGELWESVLSATQIGDVAERLARLGPARMPSLGVFFWADGHLRAMVRGDVDVYDADTGELAFSGAGVQTWTEVAVQATRVRIELEPVADESALVLPMVVGGAQISSLLLDTTEAEAAEPAVARSPEATEELAAADVPVPAADPEGGSIGACAPAVQPSIEHDIELFVTEPADAPTEQLQATAPVLAVLRAAGQDPIPVEGAVVIGRAPQAAADAGEDPLLMTVLSPSQDISRSHVQVSIRDGELTVTDLHSTNGTTLIHRDPALGSERLPAGEAVFVELGDVLDLGDGVTVAVDAPAEPRIG